MYYMLYMVVSICCTERLYDCAHTPGKSRGHLCSRALLARPAFYQKPKALSRFLRYTAGAMENELFSRLLESVIHSSNCKQKRMQCQPQSLKYNSRIRSCSNYTCTCTCISVSTSCLIYYIKWTLFVFSIHSFITHHALTTYFRYFLLMTCMQISAWILVMISIERLVCIYVPLKIHLFANKFAQIGIPATFIIHPLSCLGKSTTNAHDDRRWRRMHTVRVSTSIWQHI